MIPALVIGSGPAGVAAATALLDRGLDVTLIDGGREVEPDLDIRRAQLAARAPERWSGKDRAEWQAPQHAAPPGQTRRYGSDFAMEPAESTFASGHDRFHLRASRAVGGLSNLWGSAVLPYAAADMADWPLTEADLAPHYRAVAAFLPIAARTDDLAARFPALPVGDGPSLAPAPQAERLIARLDAARDRLAEMGVTAGQARQAVAPGCRACGQCLHGCPWQLIWKAQQQLDRLRSHPRFTHRPGLTVRAISERSDRVVLHLDGGEVLEVGRVFLAAGVLESARILLASRPDWSDLSLRDSAHGFLPLIHLWRAPRRPDRGAFHTLTQAFAELRAPDISAHLVHAQFYGWNDFFERDLMQRYARRLPGSGPLLRALARRLIVAQIFLHSDLSASARLSLSPDGRLMADLVGNPATRPAFDAAARRFGRALAQVGLAPLTPARRLNPAGSSFHAGASLPMSVAPGSRESDLLGRPQGLTRLHVVDASVLPAVPATTITLPVMANAHRIATIAP
jgi:choline dehydrogenase-like flavoprotein